jgi:glyoxylase-like metal-dependent hydrolase (beta-lactamase superfamily II)
MHKTTPVALFALFLAIAGAVSTAAAQTPTRGIVNITGQLYRAQNNNHYNVFLVTPEGIIMTDPINRDFSLWLKAELAGRFTVPVRYVLYSHKDWDHASGGAVFADTAEFVGHASMPQALAVPAGHLPLPENARGMDANRNGLIERSEATGQLADRFALTDANRDHVLSGAEVARGALNDVYPPTMTFSDRHEVTLGGKRAVMVYVGVAHSPDSTVIHFPDERTVFGADILQVRRLPGGLTPTAGAWIDMMETVLALDFEHAATGHALMGTRQDMVDLMQYLQDISRGVAAGVGAGRSLEQIQQSLTLDAYKGWDRYDTNRATHIAQIYGTLQGAP